MSLESLIDYVGERLEDLVEIPGAEETLVCPEEARGLIAAGVLQRLGVSRETDPASSELGEASAQSVAPRPAPFLLYVTSSSRRAERISGELSALGRKVPMFPSWETLPHERLSPRVDTMGIRCQLLHQLAHPEAYRAEEQLAGLVVPVRALLQPVNAQLAEFTPLELRRGQEISLTAALNRLLELGYERVDLVRARGEVAVRGGILDVFVPTEDSPQRLDFFGDEIDEIRYFSLSNQRSFAPCERVWAPSCKELYLSAEVRSRARQLMARYPDLAGMLENISEGVAVEGMESLLGELATELRPLASYLPPTTVVLFDEVERLRARADEINATNHEFALAAWENAVESAAGGSLEETGAAAAEPVPVATKSAPASTGLSPAPLSVASTLLTWEESRAILRAASLPLISLTSFPQPELPQLGATLTEFTDPTLAPQRVAERLASGWSVYVVAPTLAAARRFVENLHSLDVGPHPRLAPFALPLERGFALPAAPALVLTEREFTGRAAQAHHVPQKKIPRSSRAPIVDPLALQRGDYVVHNQHGIGRFVEMVQRTGGASRVLREYLVLEYAPSKRGQAGDLLYVPTDALDQVSRYTGSDTPALNRLGGADWEKTKARARAATKEIAAELIRIYAARQSVKGHAFGPDTEWQRELEESFEYSETSDQLAAIAEVKADMCAPQPMDRLLCGDVGYGKTEVAVRAAFKAIQDGKQVALLVPTTLLVKQHFDTFSTRYAPFPVRLAQLSRFTSSAQAKQVKTALARGEIDLVIGTHTLLTGDVRFKDLGLVIIDEEQRFGVEHKETLQAMRANVDVLSMSATPIPRTLEMAVTGIRELSTLATPPEDRRPVLTFVGEYKTQQVKAAIKRELMREGQVFYIHNRVETIAKAAAEVQQLVPEARVAVAHGKMSEKQLEAVMVDFWNREFDVLVCTTIVETGLDIANANTLIVTDAQKMGLSQLHQLRGRVGRSKERAYAYFFYPPLRALTETAHERLRALASHTDLGAGAAIAQKDLELRGAGNLLGAQQSGHIAGVGFDLYVRMVSQAVAQFKQGLAPEADSASGEKEIRIELPVDAHIPPAYVPGENLRLEMYQKLSGAYDEQARAQVREELEDRYGPVPAEVELLFRLGELRSRCRCLGIEEIAAQGKYVRFGPLELRESQVLRLKRLHPGAILKAVTRQVLVPLPRPQRLGATVPEGPELIEWAEGLLEHVFTPF